MRLTEGSLFAGIGGFSLAFEMAGFVSVWNSEIDPFCNRVLSRHFPHAAQLGDIHTVSRPPYVDVITAGFPCQPFSIAGDRKGLADPRAGVINHMFRIIEEVYPGVCVFENSPNFTRIDRGRTYRSFLSRLADSGYDAEWCFVRASDAGAPHLRERWICVGYANRQRYTKPQPSPQDEAHGQQYRSLAQARRRDELHAFESAGQILGHADGVSVQGKGSQPAARSAGRADHHPTSRDGLPQSRLDRIADGVSAGLHPGWPALPGRPQFAYEPPRTTSRDTPLRIPRTKALGNAIVPQVIYPIALSIRAYLLGYRNALP